MGILEISYLTFWWVLLAWLLTKFGLITSLGFSKIQISALFSLKVLVGIGFLLFYELYYGDKSSTDALRFYNDGNTLFQVFKSDPITYFKIILGIDMQSESVVTATNELNNWYKEHLRGVFNDNMTIIRFNALVRLISFDVYHVHTLIVNFVGFLGLAALVKNFKQYGLNQKLTFLSLLLFPGILFWTSGVLKESLLLFTIGFLVHYLFKTLHQFKLKNVGFLIVFLLLSLLIKSYVAFCVLIGFVLLLVYRIIKDTSVATVLYLFLIPILGIVADKILSLKIPERIYQKQHDFLNELAISQPGSAFEIFVLEPSWWSLIKNAPYAIGNTLFRPFIWEAHSSISLLASFEVILLFSIALITFRLKQKVTNEKLKITLFLFISAMLISLIVGWVTPVFGALVRYKIPALIFILIAFNLIIDYRKIPIISKWLS